LMECLFAKAARNLAGRPVVLRFCAPSDPAVRYGQVSAVGDAALVELDPALDMGMAYDVLLHECAHARLHFARFASAGSGAAPETPLTAAVRGLVVQVMEMEAKQLAWSWDAWAQRQPCTGTVAEKLLALCHWANDEQAW